ncbi:DoxX family protein [Rhabdobacter roseus]|uniref:Putative membrane protein YphA (DoxX/SURF4 family) n=1 Tax=Rhabdobacter roseus TaxID=1655419 RepID=A0A840TQV8_9BACT|nr:DoxX family protein [Rhabdobacter roseus]MBB5286251.1 putative membrane protein YphA (DoxX/SURF4 family) [Rhabdobacter roseus]
MTNPQSPSKVLHISLWVAQVLLALGLLYGGSMKLFQPADTLAAQWPWTAQVPLSLVKLTGVVDFLGAAGLLLPAWLRIRPALTPVAALGVLVLMLCAILFHVVRGEVAVIGINVFFAVLAAWVAWGRFRKVPLAAP